MSLLIKVKISAYVKPKINISLPPGAGRLRQVFRFQHALGVAEHQLEYVPAGLYIPAQGERVMYGGGDYLAGRQVIIFCIDAHAFGNFHPATQDRKSTRLN